MRVFARNDAVTTLIQYAVCRERSAGDLRQVRLAHATPGMIRELPWIVSFLVKALVNKGFRCNCV